MITHISVQNYALIERLELSFNNGFSVFTGETGAGKSILLGAIGLCLGKRADASVLKNTDAKCVVELSLATPSSKWKSSFEELDIDFQEESIFRREVTSNGRSRSFVNDTPVKLETLQRIGSRLVDIHSQHDTILLNNSAYQLEIVDAVAKNSKAKDLYSADFNDYLKAKRELQEFQDSFKGEIDVDYLTFLVSELDEANIQNDELESLRSEMELLEKAEEIQMALSSAQHLLENDNAGVVVQLNEIIQHIKDLSGINSIFQELHERLESSLIELKDISQEVELESTKVELNPQRLQEVQERYNMLQHLLSKHRVNTLEELTEKHQELADQLFAVNNRSGELERLEKEVKKCHETAIASAAKLTDSRIKVSKKLQLEINKICKELNFQSPDFRLNITPAKLLSQSGNDEMKFLFSANKGHEPKPLAKAASGGELSRVMLALKSIMAQSHDLPAIIFDEIDTGVSGDTATKVAGI
ncbi:MAG: DNA repair protein RecN, partial [Schleiferiaceae bacterium]|nr:DNA repair protein RecN [Schleiferiaceae bacterium]